MDTKSLEFNWQPSKSQGANLSIFTHVLDVFRYSTAVGGLDVRMQAHKHDAHTHYLYNAFTQSIHSDREGSLSSS